MSGPEKIETILKNSVSIELLTKIAEINYELDGILSSAIPPELHGEVFFGHFENKTVTLLANSPLIATKVRFISPEILRETRDRAPNHDIERIEIKISLNVPDFKN